jgi:hypothetical protein
MVLPEYLYKKASNAHLVGATSYKNNSVFIKNQAGALASRLRHGFHWLAASAG